MRTPPVDAKDRSAMTTRYALYVIPEDGTALARLGDDWLHTLPADLTAEARVYGFHATLKAPFRLAPGKTEAQLLDECATLARQSAAIAEAPPVLARLHDFYALRPSRDSAAIHSLAAEAVRRLDPFRAPLNERELAKRLAAPLSERQRHLLEHWGYPYVFDEYRFHLTLTRRLDQAEAPRVEALLRPLVAEAEAEALRIASVCLMRQHDGGVFTLLQRFTLEGSCASSV
jgi:hypothetical protein